jgi:hypothetical protein
MNIFYTIISDIQTVHQPVMHRGLLVVDLLVAVLRIRDPGSGAFLTTG